MSMLVNGDDDVVRLSVACCLSVVIRPRRFVYSEKNQDRKRQEFIQNGMKWNEIKWMETKKDPHTKCFSSLFFCSLFTSIQKNEEAAYKNSLEFQTNTNSKKYWVKWDISGLRADVSQSHFIFMFFSICFIWTDWLNEWQTVGQTNSTLCEERAMASNYCK